MKRPQNIFLFERLNEDPLNDYIAKAQAEGQRAIGYTCSYIPEPLLNVDGLVPVRMRAPGVAGTPMADTYMSSVICAYTRSLLEFALEGRYSTLDGWVFSASCDHLRRLYDNLAYLQAPPFNYIIDLPHKATDSAINWFEEELRLLALAISEKFQVDTGEQAIQRAIENHNVLVDILSRIGMTRCRQQPAISGRDFHILMIAASSSPKEMIIEKLRELSNDLEASEGIADYRARVMIVGSQLDDSGYINVIESVGALVVADRFCLGSIPGLKPIKRNGSPLHTLASHYLQETACPRMMGAFGDRVVKIKEAAAQFKVDGIIIETMKFCDCWGVEAVPLAEDLRQAGMPVLRLEKEYSLSGEGQLRTRVQAFLESMGK